MRETTCERLDVYVCEKNTFVSPMKIFESKAATVAAPSGYGRYTCIYLLYNKR